MRKGRNLLAAQQTTRTGRRPTVQGRMTTRSLLRPPSPPEPPEFTGAAQAIASTQGAEQRRCALARIRRIMTESCLINRTETDLRNAQRELADPKGGGRSRPVDRKLENGERRHDGPSHGGRRPRKNGKPRQPSPRRRPKRPATACLRKASKASGRGPPRAVPQRSEDCLGAWGPRPDTLRATTIGLNAAAKPPPKPRPKRSLGPGPPKSPHPRSSR